ncbi:MAG: cytochrome P450 [Devosia sp.]
MTDEIDRPGQEWDPVGEEARRDTFAVHADLRARCPVPHSTNWGGFYTATRYADILDVSRRTEDFTATRQTVIPASPRKGLPRLPLQADPPEHGRYRKALNVWFKEARIRALDAPNRAELDALLGALPEKGVVDIVAALTEPFPVRSLCLLIGLDLKEGAELTELSNAYIVAVQTQDLPTAGELSRRIDGFATGLVADRKVAPRDPDADMVTGLLAADGDGTPFTDEEVAGMIRLLLIGGHTVPRNFLGSAIWHLAEHPELQQQLREDPALIRPAVEELLRLYSPNQALVRVARHDTEVGGRAVPEGCPVALLFLSANRDEAVFEAPHEFRLDRRPNRHIAFGYGTHVCIGQSLGRMQARLAIEALLARPGRFALAAPVEWAHWTEFGVAGMRLRFDA